MHDHIERILFPEPEILSGIDRVAAEITEAYRGRDFTVVSVLKGSCVFASDLIRRIPIPLELAFLAASSYGDGTTAGGLHELARRGASEVRTCVFLDKPARREVPISADFRCFEVENLFVVGYGLDFAGHYRNLPYVGALREEVYARALNAKDS
jgi:hypoxanthine phosphoribosyltransferase